MSVINAGSFENLRQQPLIQDKTKNEAEQVVKWSNDYYKILSTKDAKFFTIQKTTTSLFLGVLFKQDITLFEWASSPYLKFMKLKGFWLPEGPNFMEFLYDSHSITQVVLGYSTEANIVNIVDSKVKEIRIHPLFMQPTNQSGSGSGSSKVRWQGFTQIKTVPLDPLPAGTIRLTFGRKLWTQTMRIEEQKQRHFLGTFNRVTKVCTMSGQVVMNEPYLTQCTWQEPPDRLIIRPDHYLIGIGKQCIECIDWKSCESKQILRTKDGTSLRVLMERSGFILCIAEKRKVGSVLYLLKEEINQLFDTRLHNGQVDQVDHLADLEK